MRVIFYSLDVSCGNTLEDIFRKNSVKYSYSKKDDNTYENFAFLIDERVMVLSTDKGVMIAMKIIADNYVFIAPDMFYYMEIL